MPTAAPKQSGVGRPRGQQPPAAAPQTIAPERPKLELPTERSVATMDFASCTKFIYGFEGVGKTTFAIETDPDHTLLISAGQTNTHLTAFIQEVHDWQDFRDLLDALIAGGHPYKHFGVDVVDELARMNQDYVCKQLGIVHPGAVDDFGQAFGMIRDEFKLRIARLCSLGGVTFISHAKSVDIDMPVGKATKAVPQFTGQASTWLKGFVDFEFYATVELNPEAGEEERVLRTEPSSFWAAKQRVERGLPHLPDPLPLDAQQVRAAMELVQKAKPKEKAPVGEKATQEQLDALAEATS